MASSKMFHKCINLPFQFPFHHASCGLAHKLCSLGTSLQPVSPPKQPSLGQTGPSFYCPAPGRAQGTDLSPHCAEIQRPELPRAPFFSNLCGHPLPQGPTPKVDHGGLAPFHPYLPIHTHLWGVKTCGRIHSLIPLANIILEVPERKWPSWEQSSPLNGDQATTT